MTWTTPMTAVADEVLTANQFNTYVRDNLNETAPAKGLKDGQYFVSTGTNNIAPRKAVSAFNESRIGIDEGARAFLDQGGPSLSVTTSTAALIFMSVEGSNTSSNNASGVIYVVSGATTLTSAGAATDAEGSGNSQQIILVDGLIGDGGTGNAIQTGITNLEDRLNPGTNVFTMHYYRHDTGDTNYRRRELIVLPL